LALIDKAFSRASWAPPRSNEKSGGGTGGGLGSGTGAAGVTGAAGAGAGGAGGGSSGGGADLQEKKVVSKKTGTRTRSIFFAFLFIDYSSITFYHTLKFIAILLN
jgi:hypothetical protein